VGGGSGGETDPDLPWWMDALRSPGGGEENCCQRRNREKFHYFEIMK